MDPTAGGAPVLRVFGVTDVRSSPRLSASLTFSQEGHSVLAHVRDFLPYFWVAAPRGFTNADCTPLQAHLNVCGAMRAR